MRRAVAVLAVASSVLLACSDGDDGANVAQASTTASSSSVTSTTQPPTTSTTSAAEALANGQCPDRPPRSQPDPNRPVYRVDATVAAGLSTVTGSLTVTFTPDRPTPELVFRLWPNGPNTALAGTHLAVGAITTGDGVELSATAPDATTVVAALHDPLAAGASITVTLPWTLTIGGSVHDRVSHSGDTLRLGTFLPLLAWEPGVGWAREPATDVFAEASTLPTADFEYTITTPAGYDVLASGARGADGVWHAVAMRDIGVSIGHFEVRTAVEALPDRVDVTVGVDRSIGESADAYLDKVIGALRDYTVRFGGYPWPTLSLAVTPGLDSSGIEYPAHIFQGIGTLGRTTSHEVGHEWFYGLIGNDQGRDPWIDEGLASYAEFTHEGTVGENVARDIPVDAVGRGGESLAYWESHSSSYYRGVYVQPAVAVAQLGEQWKVDCALSHLVARAAYRVATPADVFDALQVVFPDAVAQLASAGLAP